MPGAKISELMRHRKGRLRIGKLAVVAIVVAATLLAMYIHELDVVFAYVPMVKRTYRVFAYVHHVKETLLAVSIADDLKMTTCARLIGGTCGIPLSLLLPSLLYMYALGDRKLNTTMSLSAAVCNCLPGRHGRL